MRSPYLVAGPFARSARDLAALLRVMAGADGIDCNVEPVTLHATDDVDWSGRRVVLLPAPRIALAARATAELQRAVREAGGLLAGRGARLVDAPADLFLRAGDIWFSALQEAGGPAFAELLGAGRRVGAVREVALAALGRSAYSWPALFFLLGEAIGQRGASGMRRARAEAARVAGAFADLLGPDGILIMPVHPRPAPRHNGPVLRPFDFLYTAIFNALRVPATCVPFGAGASGLPLAVQIAARAGSDHLTLAAAAVLEDALPAWRPARAAAV
jgi:fatty acid amide hydrolase 2